MRFFIKIVAKLTIISWPIYSINLIIIYVANNIKTIFILLTKVVALYIKYVIIEI